jgi:hypothetical protein
MNHYTLTNESGTVKDHKHLIYIICFILIVIFFDESIKCDDFARF